MEQSQKSTVEVLLDKAARARDAAQALAFAQAALTVANTFFTLQSLKPEPRPAPKVSTRSR